MIEHLCISVAGQRPEVSGKVDDYHRVSNDRYRHNLLIYNDLRSREPAGIRIAFCMAEAAELTDEVAAAPNIEREEK